MIFLKSYSLFESSNNISAKSYNSQDFQNLVYDERDDIEKRIRFFTYPLFTSDGLYYSVLFDGDKIIGICKIGDDGKDNNLFKIAYCSIDREYRGKGYLRILIEELIKFCKKSGFSLGATRWTVPGMLKLRPILNELSKKYGVEFKDHDKKFDHTNIYNSDLVNVNEMTPKELEDHKRISHLKPKHSGFFGKIFYDTGDYKIYSTKTEFDNDKLDNIYNEIKDKKV